MYRVCGELDKTDNIMNRTFWIGVYPAITKEMMKYIIDKIKNFIYGDYNV